MLFKWKGIKYLKHCGRKVGGEMTKQGFNIYYKSRLFKSMLLLKDCTNRKTEQNKNTRKVLYNVRSLDL